jgi:phosphatidylinositol-3-phosphatase
MPSLPRWPLAVITFAIIAAGGYVLGLAPSRADLAELMEAARYVVASPVRDPQPVPTWRQVTVIVLENRDYDEILGAPDAPFLASLAARGAVASNTWDVGGASQPNYLAMTSGTTHLITDNLTHELDAPSIFDQLEAVGMTWRVSAEQYPGGCFAGETASGGRDGPGLYTRAHNPAISFVSIMTDPVRCANIQDHTAFEPGQADFALVVPDACHNTHDCPVAVGDAWLSRFVPAILDAPGFWDDGLLIITFDGGSDVGPDDGHRIAVTMVGAGVRSGTVSETRYDHYNVLRTVQEGLGLPCLARSCDADTMADLFER